MSRVTVIGSINQDIVITMATVPGPGQTLAADDCRLMPGGKGANQAVAAALMSVPTRLVGNVGDDAFGPSLLQYLSSRGVQTRVQTVTGSTGTASIWVDRNGENRIALSGGANQKLAPDDALTRAEIHAGDIIVVQNEIPFPVTEAVLRHAHRGGAATLFNPAPARELDDELLNAVDYLIVNEHEFAVVFDRSLPPIDQRRDVVQAIEQAAESLRGSLVVTLGPAGVVACIDGTTQDIATTAVEAVDTTGAGDCFVGVFAASLAEQLPTSDGLQRAVRAATLSVRRPGASASFPTREELEA
jgi:ribokinase